MGRIATFGPRRARPPAMGLVVALVLAACGGNTGSTPTSADETTGENFPVTEAIGEAETAATDGSTDTQTDLDPDKEIVVDIDEIEEPEPVAGGTLRYALEADVDGLNPTASALTSAGQNMANAVFDTLAAFTDDGTAVPYLADRSAISRPTTTCSRSSTRTATRTSSSSTQEPHRSTTFALGRR